MSALLVNKQFYSREYKKYEYTKYSNLSIRETVMTTILQNDYSKSWPVFGSFRLLFKIYILEKRKIVVSLLPPTNKCCQVTKTWYCEQQRYKYLQEMIESPQYNTKLILICKS